MWGGEPLCCVLVPPRLGQNINWGLIWDLNWKKKSLCVSGEYSFKVLLFAFLVGNFCPSIFSCCHTMDFDFNTFRENPSLAQVDACRVGDLMLIANWLGVDLPPALWKGELKELVVTALQEKVLVGARGVREEE